MKHLLKKILELNSLSGNDFYELHELFSDEECNLTNVTALLIKVIYRQNEKCKRDFNISLCNENFEINSLEQIKMLWETIIENENKYNSTKREFENYVYTMLNNK